MESVGLVDAAITFRIDKQWGPAVQHRNSVQSLGLEHDGREYEKKECMYVYDSVILLYSRN